MCTKKKALPLTSMMEVLDGQEWIMDMINNLLIEVLSTMAQQERVTIKQRLADYNSL